MVGLRKNNITRENGYDIEEESDGRIIIKEQNGRWKPLHTKAGKFYTNSYKGVKQLNNKTISDLGVSNFR